MGNQVKIMIVATILSLAGSSYLEAAGVGTTGATFLKVGVGGRPLSMAGASVASSDDANAIYWNPAGLAGLEKRNVTVSYNSLFQDQNQGFLAFASPLPENKGSLGLGLNYLQVSNIEKRTEDTENPDSKFSNQNYAVALSYAKKDFLLDRLSAGLSLKYIRVKLDTFGANAFATDLGAVHKTTDKLSLGLSVQNLGSKIGPDHLPLVVRAGGAYKLWRDQLTLALDGEAWLRDERNYLDLGMEYWVVSQFALRGGYQFGRAVDKLGTEAGLAAGMGFRMDKIGIDYAFVPFGDLGHTHRITLGARF